MMSLIKKTATNFNKRTFVSALLRNSFIMRRRSVYYLHLLDLCASAQNADVFSEDISLVSLDGFVQTMDNI